MNRRFWPAMLAAVSVLVLGSYLVYTQYLVQEIRREAAIHSQVYSIVQRGLAGGIEGGPLQALNDLQTQLQNLQVPIIVFDTAGDPVYANNLPFEYDASSPESVEEVHEYARRLAERRPRNRAPVHGGGSMVFGDPPVLNWLRFVPWLQVGAGALLIGIALVIMRADMRAHRERLWSAMARELAHQMGTPLSSLAGWVEVLQLTADERTAMAETDYIGRVMQADVERLERVSLRFELIGKPPALEHVAVADVVDELVSYFRPRLPHLGKGIITLRAHVDRDLPSIRANQVLLVWALENIIKNAIDALAGRGGRISFIALRGGRPPAAGTDENSLHLVITDNGPGIAQAVRDRIFEPGVTTKAGGWGVGLSLSLRIVEELHHGRITVHNRPRGGTVFDVVLPVSKDVMEANYLDNLNPEQRAAVEHFEGPILTLAGAGSGKTRVLTTRIAHLINEHGVDPSSILAVTFTNKAAAEMRARIRRLLGREPAGMWMGTFHSIGARLLRRHATRLGWTPNFTIYDADEALREAKRALERLNHSPKRWNPKAVHSTISSAKNQLVGPEHYARTAADVFSQIVAEVYPVYEAALRDQNAFDFDDLLVKPVELLRGHEEILTTYRSRFSFVLVDEYQDTNHAQYVFLQLIAGGDGTGNMMVVGDDDQSIYGWRGADIRNILDFEKDFPNARIVRLEQNYRSTGRILDAANAIISKNTKRKGKTLRTDAGPGELITIVSTLDERDEADWIGSEIQARVRRSTDVSPRDFVVLYRTNSQSRAMEEAFRRRDIAYQIVGGTRFYERREIMDALAYLRLISNPRDAGAFDRIVNYPRRGIGDTSRAKLLEWATQHGMTPLEAALRADEHPDLRGGAAQSFVAFAGMIQRYTALAGHIGVGELVEKLVAEIGMIDALRDEGPEGADRIENVNELIAGAADFDERADIDEEDAVEDATALDMFLQKVTLLTDVDRHDPEAKAVTLMTAHNAKGLEFPVVFIAGMEDGLFPLARAFDEPDTLEEERRLFYVAITRAERKLFISHARTRRRAGEVMPGRPSSFLDSLPSSLTDALMTPGLERARHAGETRWSRRDPVQGVGSLGYRDRNPAGGRSPRFEGSDDGVYIDYTDAQDAPRFVKGERVRHPQFGRGVIRDLTGFGQDLKAVIDFDAIGRKKVVLRYANLQKEL